MLFDNKYGTKKPELSKLISFAFDLYSDKLDYFNYKCDLFPRCYTSADASYDVTRIPAGIVWGKRDYANHSDSSVFTEIGLTVGEVCDEQLIFDYAIEFDTNNKKQYAIINLLDYDRKKIYAPELEVSFSSFTDLSEEEQINIFIKSMVILGFNEEDVKAVLNGTMTAREAYMNIAPEDKKYKQWVDIGRQYFEFDKNIAINGHFGNVTSFDDFPFPFAEEVIIDCSKAQTSAINLEGNKRKVRLINVNENKKSILYANLRNAIIEEVIDLSKVDATGTKFGHQKVCNLMYSIAKLEDMDLTLACDIDGNTFKTDDKGRARIDGFGDPILDKINLNVDEENKTFKILANVDSSEMAVQTLNTHRDGVGLIRTETLFYEREKLEKYMPLFLVDDYDIDDNDNNEKELLEEFKQEQKQLLETIFSNLNDDFITVRLFDFRLQDILRYSKKSISEIENEYYRIDSKVRGASYLENCHEKLLKAQVEAIFEVCEKLGRKVNILVPYIDEASSLEFIKRRISNINKTYQVVYKLGAMVENVESVSQCDRLSRLVDFISFGLNDLTESVTKKVRDTRDDDFCYINDEVKELMTEAVYRAKIGNKDIIIGACGEHTNYIENLEFLNSIGVQYISVSPYMIAILQGNLNRTNKGKILSKK